MFCDVHIHINLMKICIKVFSSTKVVDLIMTFLLQYVVTAQITAIAMMKLMACVFVMKAMKKIHTQMTVNLVCIIIFVFIYLGFQQLNLYNWNGNWNMMMHPRHNSNEMPIVLYDFKALIHFIHIIIIIIIKCSKKM